jgi:hypothetical protein
VASWPVEPGMKFSVRFVSLKGNRKGEVETFTLLSKLGGIPNQ